MSLTKRSRLSRNQPESQRKSKNKNKTDLVSLLDSFIANGMFAEDAFHGNIKWNPEHLAKQALTWAWQESRHVTDAFAVSLETCSGLGLRKVAKSYTSFINALFRYQETFSRRLDSQLQSLIEEAAGQHWRNREWVPMAFDGSRLSTPRTASNEREFCAPNYGKGKTAKYRRKKTKGMRRRANQKNKPQPQRPQAWITMLWHMGVRIPWAWRLGPSNSSERQHVREMLAQEEIPENTLLCGDAGFVGYDFWKAILDTGSDLLIRVGANVNLLSEQAHVKRLGDGRVLCWPKGKMMSEAPLRLRLVKIQVGKTKMWMLTNVLDRRRLTKKMMVSFYKMRWGVEVEFRGLKQTNGKSTLRSRTSTRAYVELDWSIRAMAFAELAALREQVQQADAKQAYDPKDRSLAQTMRALRTCMRNWHTHAPPGEDLFSQLRQATIQNYQNSTDKTSRYRPKNPDKRPLGEPTVRKATKQEQRKIQNAQRAAA